jgi:L,D-peptidoglycan transpeptidase YkuD (ErfK/YbiS/YcfS/YnhG family)
MPDRPLNVIHIVTRPSGRTLGVIRAGIWTIPVALGRSGIRANKREGDGGTPRGVFHPLRIWWRADRLKRPRSHLPLRAIGPMDAWCEDPRDRRYNRPFKRSANEPGDLLARDDHVYDLVVEIDHNVRPRVAGRGSAVFIHLARKGFTPTAGCIALGRRDLIWLVERLGRHTRIMIRD